MNLIEDRNGHTAKASDGDANGLAHAPESSSRLPVAHADTADRDVTANTPQSDSGAVRQDPDASTGPSAEMPPASPMALPQKRLSEEWIEECDEDGEDGEDDSDDSDDESDDYGDDCEDDAEDNEDDSDDCKDLEEELEEQSDEAGVCTADSEASDTPTDADGTPPDSPETTPSASAGTGLPQPPTASMSRTGVALKPEYIVKYALEAKIQTFQDVGGTVFAWIPVTTEGREHHECISVGSQVFKTHLLSVISNRNWNTPTMAVLNQATEMLKLQAYREPRRKLDNRRASADGHVFIDMGDSHWRMIHASRDGWAIEPQSEPRFFRPQHMLPLPEPQRGGNIADLFTFVPVETASDRLLLTTWLMGGLYPAIQIPMLLFVGQQGSAKTTRSVWLRSLLDPSSTPGLGDVEAANLFRVFQHHAVPVFENVSSFNRSVADIFCRAVTGNGVERRRLFTDDDEVLFSFRRPIIINGIESPSTRPDFLDRCLFCTCQRIQRFIPYEIINAEFEANRPKLFGAMLDLLVETLRALDSMTPSSEFRMADFARFGRAVAVATGGRQEDFDEAYRLNVSQQLTDTFEDAPMCRVLEKFAINYASRKPWVGTADELLRKLRELAHATQDADGRRDLPNAARWLSTRLGELAPAMANRGVSVRRLPRTNAARLWEVSTPQMPDPEAAPVDLIDFMCSPE